MNKKVVGREAPVPQRQPSKPKRTGSAREAGLVALQSQAGNAAVSRLVAQAGSTPELVQRAPTKEVSVFEQRFALFRKAVIAKRWGGGDQDSPSAFWILNGLSLDDIQRMVSRLSKPSIAELLANIDQAEGFDHARIYAGIQRAKAQSDWWGQKVEEVHNAIRAGSFGEYPQGAYWQINGLNKADIGKLMTFLDRDHLDELVSHQGEGMSVPNISLIVADAMKARSTSGGTKVEKQVAHLVSEAKQNPDQVESNAKAIFRLINTLNNDGLRRLVKSSREVADFLLAHLELANGIADVNRLRATLPQDDPHLFEVEVGAGGEMTVITDRRADPNYIDRRVEAVGYGVYVGGFLVFLQGIEQPILVPEGLVDFGPGAGPPLSEQVFPTKTEADQALAAKAGAPPPRPGYAYYEGAGGRIVAPTMLSRANAPNTVNTMWTAVQKLKDEVQHELVVIALSLVGGIALGAALNGLVRVGELKLSNPRIRPGMAGEGSAEGAAGAGTVEAEAEADTEVRALAATRTARPYIDAAGIRAMQARGTKVLTWRSFDADVVANQPIRPTRQTNPNAPEYVFFGEGYKGFGYGDKYMIVEQDAVRPIYPNPNSPGEWYTTSEVPADQGHWTTRAEVDKALSKK
jgi:hypothetical protein